MAKNGRKQSRKIERRVAEESVRHNRRKRKRDGKTEVWSLYEYKGKPMYGKPYGGANDCIDEAFRDCHSEI